MKRRKHSTSTKLDIDSMTARLIPVKDESESREQRHAEALELVAHLIRLATKRGPVKKSTDEVQDEAA